MRIWAMYHPSMYLIGSLGVVLLIAVGTKAVLAGAMQLGDFIAFLMLTGFLYEPIGKLHQLNQLMQAGRAAGERVFQILDEPEEPAAIAGIVDSGSTRILGDIRYQDVSFSYAEGLPALKRVSFHAPPSATIALVGATGSGKSTLVNLLARFYEFSDGEIYVDEKPIRQYDLPALRESIGVVTQESFLFNGSIREKSAHGKTGRS